VRQICDRHDVLFIADEILVGAGRTGTWSALEPDRVVPDIQVFGKGIAAGFAPLAAVVASSRIADAIANRSGAFNHAQTFSHHAVSCAAGTATLRYLAKHRLVERCREMGAQLHGKLRRIEHHPNVGAVRGRGLLAGIELTAANAKPFPRSAHVAEEVTRTALHNGLIVWPNVGHANGVDGDLIMVAPPFVVSEEELDQIVEGVERAITMAIEKIGTVAAHDALAGSKR
jgi:adenosylmethionine-8-amino-7-oxononanoate aminotransferase